MQTPFGNLFKVCIIVIIICCSYYFVMQCDFVMYDDHLCVTDNEFIRQGISWQGVFWIIKSSHNRNWHPMTSFSHMLDSHLYGLLATGHHFTNLIIHILNTLLLFCFLSKATGNERCSFAVALLFAVHPTNVEAVAWISERKGLLCAFFWFLSMLLYVQFYLKKLRFYYFLALITAVLAMMSKAIAVTLPFTLLLLDGWPLKRIQNEKKLRLFLEKLPFFIFAIVFSILTYYIQAHGNTIRGLEEFSLDSRLKNVIIAYCAYIYKLFWPHPLTVLYPFSEKSLYLSKVLLCFVALTTTTVLAIRVRKKHPYFLFGWLWYLGNLVTTIGIVQIGYKSMADRYMYIPEIGIFIAIVWATQHLVDYFKINQRLVYGLFVFVLLCCVFITQKQTYCWKNTESLFSNAVKNTKDNYIMHGFLAMEYLRQGQLKLAFEHCQASIEIEPTVANSHYIMGSILTKSGKPLLALKSYQKAVNYDPKLYNAFLRTGEILELLKFYEQAAAAYNQALEIRPDWIPILIRLAKLKQQTGDLEAIEIYGKILQINPKYAEAYYGLGICYEKQNKILQAIQAYIKAITLKPEFAEAHYRLQRLQNK